MTTRVTIRAAAVAGFNGRFRAGRFWPVSGTIVDLIDADDDAEDVVEKNAAIPQIGKKTLGALRADGGAFSFDNTSAVADVTARATELEAENAALKARIAELEGGASNKGKGQAAGK